MISIPLLACFSFRKGVWPAAVPAIVAQKKYFLSVSAFIHGPFGFPWLLQMPESPGLLLLRVPVTVFPPVLSNGVRWWEGDEEGTVCSLLASYPILPQAVDRLFPRIQMTQQHLQMAGKGAASVPMNQKCRGAT